MKISFISTSHFPKDDRIYYHFAKSVATAGHEVEITTSNIDLHHRSGRLYINSFEGNSLPKKKKIQYFIQNLKEFVPDTIICSEPLCILAAYKYKKNYNKTTRIISDITEWYPSKKNLNQRKSFARSFLFVKLSVFNLYTAFLTDAFIFGEWYKSVPSRILFPLKERISITYYPSKKYFQILEPKPILNEINLSYSGKISKEKGFENFIQMVNELSRKRSNLKINLKIIGWPENQEYKKLYHHIIEDLKKRNINIIEHEKLNLKDYINEIKDTDIFIDLRSNDFENQMCLPIRLFYFAALGRPVIFSDLKAIRKEVKIEKFGYLVDPKNSQQTIDRIIQYIDNYSLYLSHCRNAFDIYNSSYNWEKIENRFLEFVTKMHSEK